MSARFVHSFYYFDLAVLESVSRLRTGIPVQWISFAVTCDWVLHENFRE
jgi:hypothetical protein